MDAFNSSAENLHVPDIYAVAGAQNVPTYLSVSMVYNIQPPSGPWTCALQQIFVLIQIMRLLVFPLLTCSGESAVTMNL
jgi:hypothetical protein